MESARESSGFSTSLDGFARNFYHHLVELSTQSDLICSPFSVQVCAGMLRMGAEEESETASQLNTGLCFSTNDVNELANSFQSVLTYYQQCEALKIANRIYVMPRIKLNKHFTNVLTEKFLSNPEYVNFGKNSKAAETINTWVETATGGLIKDLVKQDDVSEDTRMVLVNAIHFKGEWSVKFDENATQSEDFFLDDKNKLQVWMMNSKQNYDFANLPSLEAKLLRMAYKDTNLYMLIILPNAITGLDTLQQKLHTMPLAEITSQLQQTKVSVKLPKFKTEFSQELTPVFQALGMARIFSEVAEFDKMLEHYELLSVSKILHKAFIEVNEEGTEAAAATAASLTLRSIPGPEPQPEIFHANHPFFYVIYNEEHGCLFMGNLKTPIAAPPVSTCRCSNVDHSKCV